MPKVFTDNRRARSTLCKKLIGRVSRLAVVFQVSESIARRARLLAGGIGVSVCLSTRASIARKCYTHFVFPHAHHIVIDGRMILPNMTGVGRYLIGFGKGLNDLPGEENIE